MMPLPTANSDGLDGRIRLEPEQIVGLKTARIVKLGFEHVYVQKNGVEYYFHTSLPERFVEGPWDFQKYPNGAHDPRAVQSQMTSVPPQIKRALDRSLSQLREHARVLAEVKKCCSSFELTNEMLVRLPRILTLQERLNLFETIARKNAVDPMAVIIELGDEPSFRTFKGPEPASQSWSNN